MELPATACKFEVRRSRFQEQTEQSFTVMTVAAVHFILEPALNGKQGCYLKNYSEEAQTSVIVK